MTSTHLSAPPHLTTRHTRTGRRRALAGAAAVLAVLLALSLGVGSYGLTPGEVWGALRTGPEGTGPASAVVWTLRLPRVLVAAAVGAALAASGAAYQASYRNPLVDPSILGVSAGAAFGAGLAVITPLGVPMSVAAFAGGVLAVTLTYVASSVNGARPSVTVILAGVVVGGIFTAGFGLLQYLATSEDLRRLVFWMLGGFYEATWSDVWRTVPAIVLLVALLARYGWSLNIIAMGDADAVALGLDPDTVRRRVLVSATALTALAVSVSGVVGWIGLLVPHAARFIVGADNRYVVPMAGLLGGLFTVVADDLARTIGAGEVPIGILTAVLGAPFLLYLLRTRGHQLVGR